MPSIDLKKPSSVLYQLKLSELSILNATFIDSKTKRHLFTSTTDNNVTRLTRFDSEHGEGTVVGSVWWEGGRGECDGQGGQALIVLHDQTMRFGELIKNKRTIFGDRSQAFEVQGMRCRWKPGANSSLAFPQMRVHFCQLTSYSEPNRAASVSAERILALLSSPSPGSVPPELLVYDAGEDILDELVLTCIMATVGKFEWRKAGERRRRRTVEPVVPYTIHEPNFPFTAEMARARSRTTESEPDDSVASVSEVEDDATEPPAYDRSLSSGEQRVHMEYSMSVREVLEIDESEEPPVRGSELLPRYEAA